MEASSENSHQPYANSSYEPAACEMGWRSKRHAKLYAGSHRKHTLAFPEMTSSKCTHYDAHENHTRNFNPRCPLSLHYEALSELVTLSPGHLSVQDIISVKGRERVGLDAASSGHIRDCGRAYLQDSSPGALGSFLGGRRAAQPLPHDIVDIFGRR